MFGGGAFKKVRKVKLGNMGGSLSGITGVCIRRGIYIQKTHRPGDNHVKTQSMIDYLWRKTSRAKVHRRS